MRNYKGLFYYFGCVLVSKITRCIFDSVRFTSFFFFFGKAKTVTISENRFFKISELYIGFSVQSNNFSVQFFAGKIWYSVS